MVRTVLVSAARMAQRRAVHHTKLRQMAQTLFAGAAPAQTTRAFAHSSITWKGIMPESADPAPRTVQPEETADAPVELTMAQYHEAADNYIEQLVQAFEALAEADAMVDVEYSAGILNLEVPKTGTYVINKQPPNKQIWLSSPISGPKRFDWVMHGEAQNQKEGGGKGEWIYLRDGSNLTKLLEEELGLDIKLIDF